MTNHYHLLVRTPRPNLSRGMRQLNGVYAQRFNRRHRRVGPIFSGRYKAILVQDGAHLLETARYVALNPVSAGICARPEGWRWSGHCALIGAVENSLVEGSSVLELFGGSRSSARRRYAEFVVQGGDRALPGAEQVIYGAPEFVAEHRSGVERSPEIPRRQCLRNPLPLHEVLAASDRDEAIARAHRDHGYLLREIADELSCHYATVSRRLRAFENREPGPSTG